MGSTNFFAIRRKNSVLHPLQMGRQPERFRIEKPSWSFGKLE
jgi:hypothetical protein